MASNEPATPLCYAGYQAHRRHNIEVLHRASKPPQGIIQQTGYKNHSKAPFGVDGFDMGKLMQYFISCFFLNALQVYSTVTKIQNGEGIARKAGSGIFPHLSHVGKNQIKAFIAQNKYSTWWNICVWISASARRYLPVLTVCNISTLEGTVAGYNGAAQYEKL